MPAAAAEGGCMSRTPLTIDTTEFEPVMAQALLCFGIDLDYASAMCAKAVVIHAKRATHAARRQLKMAEAEARTACAAAGTFTCANRLPCGVGPECRVSTGVLRDLDVQLVPLGPQRGGRTVERPQPGPEGTPTTYNVEVAVYPYRDRLASTS
jgi:hypothetical protein